MPCWYFSKAVLRDSPSFRDGIDAPTQVRYRREGTRFIMEAGDKLDLHYETCATAVVYFHRFYVLQSFKSYPRFVTATSCLLLAMKMDKISVVGVAQSLVGSEGILSTEQLKVFGDDYLARVNAQLAVVVQETVILAEQAILETLKFDLIVTHPYSYLIKFIRQIKGDASAIEQLLQMAWTFINDGLSVSLCVEWEPDLLALAYVYLAARLTKFTITDWDGRLANFVGKWYTGLVPDASIHVIKDVCEQILVLYSGDLASSDSQTITTFERQNSLADNTAQTASSSAAIDRGRSLERKKKRSHDLLKRSSGGTPSRKETCQRSASRDKPIRLRSPNSASAHNSRTSESTEVRKFGDVDWRSSNERRQRSTHSPASRADSRKRSAASPAQRTGASKRKRSVSPQKRHGFGQLQSPSRNVAGGRSFSPMENHGYSGSATEGRRMGFSPVSEGNMSDKDWRGERVRRSSSRSAALELTNFGARGGVDFRSASRDRDRDYRLSPLRDQGRDDIPDPPDGRLRDTPNPTILNPFSSLPPPINSLVPLSREEFERLQAELRIKTQVPFFEHPGSLPPPPHALPGVNPNPPDYSASMPPVSNLYSLSHPFGQAPGGPPMVAQFPPPPLQHPYVVQTPQGFVIRPPPGVPGFPLVPPPAMTMEIPPLGFQVNNQPGLQPLIDQQLLGAGFFQSGGYTLQQQPLGVAQNVVVSGASFTMGIPGQQQFIPERFLSMPSTFTNLASVGQPFGALLVGQPLPSHSYMGPPVSISGIVASSFVSATGNFPRGPAQQFGDGPSGIPTGNPSPATGMRLSAPPDFTPSTQQRLPPSPIASRSNLIEPVIVSITNAGTASSRAASAKAAPSSRALVQMLDRIAPNKPKPVVNVCTSVSAGLKIKARPIRIPLTKGAVVPNVAVSGGGINSDGDVGRKTGRAKGEEELVEGGGKGEAGAEGESKGEGASGCDATQPIVIGDESEAVVTKAPSFIPIKANKESISSVNPNPNRIVSEVGVGKSNKGASVAGPSGATMTQKRKQRAERRAGLARPVSSFGVPRGSTGLPHRFQGMRCLIIGHTFVLQLHNALVNFDLWGAEVLIDGLAEATVNQVAERIFTMDKARLQFDVVFIDVGSFDFLDPAKTPQYVVTKILDIVKYMRIECRVARVFVNRLVTLPVLGKPLYVEKLVEANQVLVREVREMQDASFWHGPTLHITPGLTITDDMMGLRKYFEAVRLALKQGIEDVWTARRNKDVAN